MSSTSAWLRRHPRIARVFPLLLSAVFIKWHIVDVFLSAQRGERVHFYLLHVLPWILTPMLAFFGLLLNFAPRSLQVRFFAWNDRMRGPKETAGKVSPRTFALVLFYFSPGLVLCVWMIHTLEQLGYH
jgi:hypothetical protein